MATNTISGVEIMGFAQVKGSVRSTASLNLILQRPQVSVGRAGLGVGVLEGYVHDAGSDVPVRRLVVASLWPSMAQVSFTYSDESDSTGPNYSLVGLDIAQTFAITVHDDLGDGRSYIRSKLVPVGA